MDKDLMTAIEEEGTKERLEQEKIERRIMRTINLPYKLADMLALLTKAELDDIRRSLVAEGASNWLNAGQPVKEAII
ncbi:hypothetical protein V1498_02775 [Peribacillus sp. SCS-26]|uniref:hypothetical protein n=1 Tax=Paraperibacillus marinus TaxID=3115295 RepID=UPI00390661E2